MSKKSRLQKEKQRQDALKKQAELDEQEEREAAKHRESKAAKKMRRSAKRGYANIFTVIASVLMMCAFWYWGFYYGGMMIVGDITGLAENIPPHSGLLFLIADLLMITGIIMSFIRKYIMQGCFTVGGSLLFLYTGHRIVLDIRDRMKKYGVTPDLSDMDTQYEKYFYPILIITAIGAAVMIYGLVRHISKKRTEKRLRDNAPVESIVS